MWRHHFPSKPLLNRRNLLCITISPVILCNSIGEVRSWNCSLRNHCTKITAYRCYESYSSVRVSHCFLRFDSKILLSQLSSISTVARLKSRRRVLHYPRVIVVSVCVLFPKSHRKIQNQSEEINCWKISEYRKRIAQSANYKPVLIIITRNTRRTRSFLILQRRIHQVQSNYN